jgi:hypothetical protein
VDARVAAAGPDVALEGRALVRVQDRAVAAVGVVEDHRVEAGEAGVGEHGGVVAHDDLEALFGAQLGDRLLTGGDGVVVVAVDLGEDEHGETGLS